MSDIIKILFFVIAGVYLASILNDAPTPRELVSGGNGADPQEEIASGAYLRSYDKNNDGVVSDQEYRLGETERITSELEDTTAALAIAQSEENRSPYADDISIVSASGRTDDEDKEYVTIKASNDLTSPVRITGWRLASFVSRKSATIPQGVTTLYPSRPWRFASPIMLNAGERAVITTGTQIGINTSFLTNICTGYLEERRDFTPSLQRDCPRLIDENLAVFDIAYDDFGDEDDYDACIDAIESVQECSTENPDRNVPTRCRNFIREKATYEGCLELHLFDADFAGDEWRIFLGKNEDLWREEREVIALVDQNGLIVDTYDY